jgi:hypothetical protein
LECFDIHGTIVGEYYAAKTNKKVKFIYIGHDVWDGMSKSVHGLCIFFISPLLLRLVGLPVAILRCLGHSAKSVCDPSLRALKRYVPTRFGPPYSISALLTHSFDFFRIGVSQEDIRRPVNATTSSALCAGRLIVGDNPDGESGSCGMHTTELAVNHAAGYIVRKKRRTIVDENPDCLEFRQKMRLLGTLFGGDHKNKAMWDDFKTVAFDFVAGSPLQASHLCPRTAPGALPEVWPEAGGACR